MRDYYEVLGVERAADARTIKRAYHKLAMEFHPDRNPDPAAEAKFKEASEAYQVLSDPDKRRIYDTRGFDGLRNQGFSGFSGVGIDEIFSNFGDLFSDFFGFGGQRARRAANAMRGNDLQVDLEITFHDAVFGCSKDVTLTQHALCKRCDGSGGEPGSQPIKCVTCQGRGQVVHGQGMFLISTTCPGCAGAGHKNGQDCRDCGGRGRSEVERTVTVRIPAGFDDGMSLRYLGEGEPGVRGGPPGNLYVRVHIAPHPSLRREGDDLVAEVNISMVDAALGTELEIEGIEGPESVKVQKGTQPNDVITLRKKGVPRLQGHGRGDLHVVCRVEVPRSLNAKQKKLLEEFAQLTKKKGLFS